MTTANMLRLVLLAAIWGSSFLFMRICAPVLGAAVLIEARVALAALFLAAVGFMLKKRLDLARNWQHFLILGFFNSALPFLLFAYAAGTLTASVLSVTRPRPCGAPSLRRCGRASRSPFKPSPAWCWAPAAWPCWSALMR